MHVFVLWTEAGVSKENPPRPQREPPLKCNFTIYTSLKVIFAKCDSENLLFSSTYKHPSSCFHTELYSEDIYRGLF